jgi:CheY-like chemotaxis protein
MSINTFTQQQLTLLVVAPNKEVLNLIKAILSADNHHILLADNEEDGFSKAKAERPDVILAMSDVQELGSALCLRVRRDPLLAKTPFVILTTSSNQKTFVTYFANGCDQVLPVPFKSIDIYAAIRKAHNNNQDNTPAKIHVLFKSGLADFVEPVELDRLLTAKEILCFHRKGGLARVGRDPIRCGKSANYSGTERRSITA